MENLSDIMKNSAETDKEAAYKNDTTLLQQTTGLPMEPNVQAVKKTEEPVTDSSGIRILTDEERAQFAAGEKVDPIKDAIKEYDKKTADIIDGKTDDLTSMLSDALQEEEARVERHEEALKDPEVVEKLEEGTDRKVSYRTIEERNKTQKNLINSINDTDDDTYDDLIPSYTDDDEVVEKKDEEEAPDPSDEKEYAEYLRSLEHITVDSEEPSVVTRIRDSRVDTVSSGRAKTKMLGDQAFLNSITKFKKDNFSTVSIPLVNSGFSVDIVGTGVIDLTQLYDKVDENTTDFDYEISKMKTVIKNVVGTHPKINPMDLRNMIHFSDYQLMAFAHICATLKDVEIATNCDECGKPFRITAKSVDLLMNMEELREKKIMIENATRIEDCSLMTSNRKITLNNQFEVTLGHPSYAEFIKIMNEIKTVTERLSKNDKIEAKNFGEMTQLMFLIRSITLPNGVITSNVYQIYLALTLITDDDMYLVQKEYTDMMKEVITPKFGIKKIVCPYCHKVNTNIAYNSLDELVFYHTQVNRFLKTPVD